ncbi:hypothetical protein ABBQ32_007187 [Trebouxia sp. C0010 RCD-2024]
MSTGSTSNITLTFFAQAESATEYAKNTSDYASSMSESSDVVQNCTSAVSYASKALQQTSVLSIYTSVSYSYYYVAYAFSSAASSVTLIDTTYFYSYVETIQTTFYSEEMLSSSGSSLRSSSTSGSSTQTMASPPPAVSASDCVVIDATNGYTTAQCGSNYPVPVCCYEDQGICSANVDESGGTCDGSSGGVAGCCPEF